MLINLKRIRLSQGEKQRLQISWDFSKNGMSLETFRSKRRSIKRHLVTIKKV